MYTDPYGPNVAVRHVLDFSVTDADGRTATASTEFKIRWDTSKYAIMGSAGRWYIPHWNLRENATMWPDYWKIFDNLGSGTPGVSKMEQKPPVGESAADTVGGSVHLATGAEVFERSLINIAGALPFSVKADYHSLIGATKTGPLGYGWKHNFETSLVPSEFSSGHPTKLTLKKGWSSHTFLQRGGFVGSARRWQPPASWPIDEYIELSGDGLNWVLHTHDRHKYHFLVGSSLGRLVAIESPDGKFIDLSYEGDRLTQVRDRVSGRFAAFSYTNDKLTSITDGSGLQEASFEYDTTGRLARLAIGGYGYTYEYDANGWMTVVKDDNGVVVTQNTYDSLGRVVSQNDARQDNQPLLFAYDETTRPTFIITTLTDRVGAVHRYVYDSYLYLLREYESPTGQKTFFNYDVEGRLTSATAPSGVAQSFSHDVSGNVTGSVFPGGLQQTSARDGSNRLLSISNSVGISSYLTWSSNGLPLAISNSSGLSTLLDYDSNGLLRSVQDQSGAQIGITNSAGLPQVVVSPTGEQTTFSYDGAGRVVSSTSPGNRVTSLAYDSRGLVTNTTYPDGTSVSFGYDHRQRVTSITGPSGSMSMSYDGNHNLVSRTDQLGRTTQFAYDGEDRPTNAVLPGGRSVTMTYDASGRPVTVSDPMGRARISQYDSAGRLSQVRFPATNAQPVVSYAYNTNGFVSAVTDGDGNVQRYGYDALGRVTSLTNAAGAVTRFDYDQLGRLTNTVSPAGRVTSVIRNDGARTSVVTDANGNATTMSYDASGRLSSLATQSGATTQYQYNASGDLHRIVEPSGQQAQLTYDSAGRVQSVSDGEGTVSYGYDQVGRLHSVSEGTNTMTRLYDALGRLTNYTDVFGNQIGYTYNQAGDLEYLIYPDGSQVRYEYNLAGQVIKITDWDGRITAYSYDSSGRMQSMQRPNGTSRTQTYWNSGRLKSASESGPDATYSWNYTYSPTGLLTNESRLPALPVPPTSTPVSFTYGSDNRLATVGSQSTSFDADGNMTLGPLSTEGGLQILRYDTRNRLTNAAGLTYTYDAENRRVALTSEVGETRFTIDPQPALDRVLAIRHRDNSTTKFVHGPGLLYSQKDGELRYHHFDYRGSTVVVTDASGVTTDTFRYGTYGELLSRTGSSQTPFQFVGQHGVQTDSNALIHMRARFFSPLIKRFVNQDVLLGEPGNAVSMNRFAYANADPASLTDPLGLAATDQSWWDAFLTSDSLGWGLAQTDRVLTSDLLGWGLAQIDRALTSDLVGSGLAPGERTKKLFDQAGFVLDIPGHFDALIRGIGTGGRAVGKFTITAGYTAFYVGSSIGSELIYKPIVRPYLFPDLKSEFQAAPTSPIEGLTEFFLLSSGDSISNDTVERITAVASLADMVVGVKGGDISDTGRKLGSFNFGLDGIGGSARHALGKSQSHEVLRRQGRFLNHFVNGSEKPAGLFESINQGINVGEAYQP